MPDTKRPNIHNYTFYTDKEYWRELARHISETKRGDHVVLMSMTFNPAEAEIEEIMQCLLHAASRGVHITFIIDAHSFMIDERHVVGPLWFYHTIPKHLPKYYKNKINVIRALEAYPNAEISIINMPGRVFSLPVAGRSHIKAAIINDQIFLGGCNLDIHGAVDMMIGWRDTATSTRLYDILTNIGRTGHVGHALSWVDRSFSVDKQTDIFIDSGRRHQSVILDEALALIDSAEKWLVITCQFFPNSITAKHLLQSIRRGVKVEVVYAHPSHHGIIGGLGQRVSILREKARLPKILFDHALSRKDPLLHAKLIACDKGLMIGSHNYVTAGVMLGTAEIALRNTSEALAKEAVATLHRTLGRD